MYWGTFPDSIPSKCYHGANMAAHCRMWWLQNCQKEHHPLLAGMEFCSAKVVLISVTTDGLSPILTCSCDQLHITQCASAVAHQEKQWSTALKANARVKCSWLDKGTQTAYTQMKQ